MDFTKKIHGVTWILYHQTVKTLKLYGEQTATFLLWLESRYNTVRYAILLHSRGNLTLLYTAVILRVSVSCLVYNSISWARYVKLWWLVVNRQWGIIWSNYHPYCHAAPSGYNESKLKKQTYPCSTTQLGWIWGVLCDYIEYILLKKLGYLINSKSYVSNTTWGVRWHMKIVNDGARNIIYPNTVLLLW